MNLDKSAPERADAEIVFMEDDSDLVPIHYKLPKPPPQKDIINYGLPGKEQKWRRFVMPPKLKEIDDNPRLSPSEKLDILEANPSYYREEIEFIKKDWERFLNGTFIYIKNKPYYISGKNYFWLQWWTIEGKPVNFRMRDRKYWLFKKMTNEDEDCIGFNYPKHRREGATNREMCDQYVEAITHPYTLNGIQSKDETHAAEVLKQYLLPVWREQLPFWYKPIWNGQNNDLSSLTFTSPLSKSNPDFGKKALNSIIDYRNSSEKAYDGLKLRKLFNDEIGKTVECDIKRRWDIQKQCLVDGSTIIGKATNASTVDEMEKGGGKNFKKLCDQSHYHKRLPETNRTLSWLYNFFMPASEGFGGDMPKHLQKFYGSKQWIDEYGFDVISPITGRPAAEEYHLAQRKAFRDAGDIEGEIEYTRQFPLKWKDCWKTSVKDCQFNLAIIEERLDYYRNGNPDKQRGDFEWADGKIDTYVIWVPKENGKFYLSWQFLEPKHSNAFFMLDGVRQPGNVRKFGAGGDAFKFKKTKTGKKSMGGGAVFMKRDLLIDPPNKDVTQMITNRFVCTYSNRPPDKNIYGEDMLMMCIYFGCKMFPELNVEFLWDYFEARGYPAYLCHSIDRHGYVSDTPGETTSPKIKEKIFREWQHYIQNFGMNERHEELLEQCKEIEDDMGPYDLFVSGGYALMENSMDTFFVDEDSNQLDYSDLFPPNIYNLN